MSSENNNCTPLTEDHGCLPATTMMTALKHSPTRQEKAKETTTIEEREITQALNLENERQLGSKAIENQDNNPSKDSNFTQPTEDDDDATKVLKETVIKTVAAAGVLETGFTKDNMAKYMLGMAQTGKSSGGPTSHVSEEEAMAFCHTQCEEMFRTRDGNSDDTAATSEAFDFFLKHPLTRTNHGSPENIPIEMKMQTLIDIRTYDEMLSNAMTSSGEDKLKVKDKLKKPFDRCDTNGDDTLDREETKTDSLVMAKSIAKLSGQPVDKFLPNIERKLDHFPDVTSSDGDISSDARPTGTLPGPREDACPPVITVTALEHSPTHN
jgi:hypothetical protein